MNKEQRFEELIKILNNVKKHDNVIPQYNILARLIKYDNLIIAWQTILGNYYLRGWRKYTSLEYNEIEKFARRISIVWYDNGELKSSTEKRKGVPHGIYQSWYPNGQTEIYSEWKLGDRKSVV